MTEKCCGTCCYHWRHIATNPDDQYEGEYWCANDMTDAYGDYTDYSDSCEEWEER